MSLPGSSLQCLTTRIENHDLRWLESKLPIGQIASTVISLRNPVSTQLMYTVYNGNSSLLM